MQKSGNTCIDAQLPRILSEKISVTPPTINYNMSEQWSDGETNCMAVNLYGKENIYNWF